MLHMTMVTDFDKPRCCRGTLVSLWVVALLVLASGGAWAWANYLQTYHFETVHEGVLYRDGNRGIREFATAIRKGGIRTVVCLIDDQELADASKPQFRREMEFCKEKGVGVVRVPVKLGGWPATADVRRFLETVQDKNRQPVLVHCAQGVRRTGMMVAAFEETVLGWDRNKAKGAVMTFGHSERTGKDVARFIDVYDGKEKSVTRQLEQSKED